MNALRPSQLWRKDAALASRIHEIVNSHPFKTAAVFALSEYASEIGNRQDAGPRMVGAMELIDKLMNMGAEPTERSVLKFNLPIDETTNQ